MNDPHSRMTLRPAVDADADAVAALYAACVRAGHTHWTDFYPGREEIDADLRDGTLYLAEAAEGVVGAVSLLATDDCEELGLPYASRNACVLCRLCVAPEQQGRGLSKLLLALSEREAVRLGYDAMHLLAGSSLERPRRLYEGAGYQRIADVRLYEHDFIAYEKPLRS